MRRLTDGEREGAGPLVPYRDKSYTDEQWERLNGLAARLFALRREFDALSGELDRAKGKLASVGRLWGVVNPIGIAADDLYQLMNPEE